ncbi:MAG TPA: DUF2017 family protein [Actinomycetaceae bacterium]|nr:DUF2017 family protein [Actinomycetaceae bacterium]
MPGGFISRVNDEEQTILVRLFTDVGALISEQGDDDPLPVPTEPSEEDPIAHLDFEPSDFDDPCAESEEYLALDPALARVFPPMSLSDPDLAGEMRSLTLGDLRNNKLQNLRKVVLGLESATNHVMILENEVDRWLAALTDVRVVLASRLGIDDESDAERVQELAHVAVTDSTPAATDDAELELALASLYAGLTWWQESLLSAMSGRGGPNYC